MQVAKSKDNNEDRIELPGMANNDGSEVNLSSEVSLPEIDRAELKRWDDPEFRAERDLDGRSDDPNDFMNATLIPANKRQLDEIAGTLQKGLDEAEQLKGEAIASMKDDLGKGR